MKRIYSLIAAVAFSANVFAQAPGKMSYQAVIRDASNVLVTNQAVGMQISILQGSASGTAVYVETLGSTTNINGLVSVEIGVGTAVLGTMDAIDWSAGPYFIKTETDPSGGDTYTITGTSELLSVPYALHAQTADSVAGIDLKNVLGTGNDADDQSIVNVNKIGIGNSSPAYVLDATGINGSRFRVFSEDDYFAGLLTKNNTHEYFIGTQGAYEAEGDTNSGFHIYDNTVGAQRMVIDASGNMGIGNPAPTAKLDVRGTFKMTDGSEGYGKVLTSDSVGNATWITPDTLPSVANTGDFLTFDGSNWVAKEVVLGSSGGGQSISVRDPYQAVNFIIALQGIFPSRSGTDPYLAEIIMFGGNFAPRGWALCNGQLLPIASNSALFSILGTTYGGDGRTTFGLPDLRGRTAVHAGNGSGLSNMRLGQTGGLESVTLTVANMPAHNHTIIYR